MTKLRQTLRSTTDLVEARLIPAARRDEIAEVERRYAIAVTPSIAELIDPADPDDPIARQFVPSAAELVRHGSERDDPIGDETKSPLAGIVHRYPDRVLLKLANVCPVYCRFCFRREMVGPGHQAQLSAAEIEAALGYIASCPAIWEVIVTGGDPLQLSPRRIGDVVRALDAIAHVKIVRFHTRVPTVAPERLTDQLIAALTQTGKTIYVSVHVNHPRELTTPARAALARLSRAGIVLVSQTVLLKGINDDVTTLEALMRALVEARVKPYYLHHGDLAPGTAHFRTTLAEGQALVQALRGRLSGLAQPTYVIDIPGGHGKVPGGPDWVRRDANGDTVIRDVAGRLHHYDDGT